MHIVFGTSWGTAMEICKEEIKQYPSHPNEHRYIHMGEIETSEISLSETMRIIEVGMLQLEMDRLPKYKTNGGSAS